MRVYGVIACAIVAGACTHVRSRPPDLSPSRRVTIVLRGGTRIDATAELLDGRVVLRNDLTARVVPTSEIDAYETPNHALGALEGSIMGAGYGAGLTLLPGLVLAAIFTSGSSGYEFDYGKLASVSVVAGAIGCVGGAVVGGVVGSTDRYDVRPRLEPRVSLSADPHGAAAIVAWSF